MDTVTTLLQRLTLDEKIGLLSGADFWHTRAVERLGIPPVMMSDGPHGLRKQVDMADHLGLTSSRPATCFPPAVNLASTWDPELVRSVGEAIGQEARAEAVAIVLGPGVNMKRSPLCGRNFEYFSEDPLLAGQLGAAFIDGVQSCGVGTCLKHFAANNQEYYRLVSDSVVDERTLRELYLNAFETAVRQSRPWSLMGAYNKLNGTYACENGWLLDEVLRREWGHEGIVITDCGAMHDRVAGLRAGLELEMPGNRNRHAAVIKRALREGRLASAELDRAVERLLVVIARCRSDSAPAEELAVLHQKNHDLAATAAEQSIVLLRNENATLPLSVGSQPLLLGPLAKFPRYQGTGSSQIVPTRLESAYPWLCTLSGESTNLPYADGYHLGSEHADPALEAEALELAVRSGCVVVFAGLPPIRESEGYDREDLGLPPNQNQLIERLCAERDRLAAQTGRTFRLVVVLNNGSPVTLPWAERVDAIVEAYLGGQAGGKALARVLFGLANPSGKLAETFPLRLEDTPAHHYFPGQPSQVEYREGLFMGYRYYDSADVAVGYPFGHGLSYTCFEYSGPAYRAVGQSPSGNGDGMTAAQPVDIDACDLEAWCTLSNTGKRAGAEVAQLYVRCLAEGPYRPFHELKGFTKLTLEPGCSATASFRLNRRSFAFWDRVSASWQVIPGKYELRIGSSSRDLRQTITVELISSQWQRRCARFGSGLSPADLLSAYRTAEVAGSHKVSDADFAVQLGRPVPKPAPHLPFTWNSTMAQLAERRLGRWLFRQVERSFLNDFAASEDEALKKMVQRSAAEMPLRSLVLMSGGKIGFRTVGVLLELLNGSLLAALRRLVGPRGSHGPRNG